jgi:hypothetical protein
LANDDPHLHTVPQQIGVSKTKIVGLLLLLPFYFLEFFKTNFIEEQLIVNLVLVLALTFFIILPMKKIQLLHFLLGRKHSYFLVADGRFLLIKNRSIAASVLK